MASQFELLARQFDDDKPSKQRRTLDLTCRSKRTKQLTLRLRWDYLLTAMDAKAFQQLQDNSIDAAIEANPMIAATFSLLVRPHTHTLPT